MMMSPDECKLIIHIRNELRRLGNRVDTVQAKKQHYDKDGRAFHAQRENFDNDFILSFYSTRLHFLMFYKKKLCFLNYFLL